MSAEIGLFDQPAFRTVLWNDQQKRIILEPAEEMTEEQIKEGNEHYKKSLCPHIRYRKKDEVPVRTFKFRRMNETV